MRRFSGALLALWLAAAAGAARAAQVDVPAVPDALPQAVAPVFPAPDLPAPPGALAVSLPQSVFALPAGAEPPPAQAAPAQPGRPAEPAPPGRLYVLSRTIDRTVALGRTAQAGHYAFEALWQAAKMGAGYHWGGWGGAAGMAVLEVPWAPLSIAGRSYVHLRVLTARDRRRLLRELAQEPGVSDIMLITGSERRRKGLLAHRQINHELAVLTSARPPAGLEARYGRAIPVADPSKAEFRVRLSVYGAQHPVEWRPTLRDIQERRAPPAEVTAAWKAALALHKRAIGWFRWLFTSRLERETRFDISVSDGQGQEQPLGILAEGKPAMKLALGKGGAPVVETRVVDKPSRRWPLSWLDALLGRELLRR